MYIMGELINLNEDIGLAILLFCDVFSILKMEQVCVQCCSSSMSHNDTQLKPETPKTCRFFEKISKERHLWLTLAMNLDYDYAPNLSPHETLKSLSTKRLREMIVRSCRTYRNWNSPNGPKPSRSVSFDVLQAPMYGPGEKLLPGGKYFVFRCWEDRFHCYDTESQLQVSPRGGLAPPGEGMTLMDCFLVDNGDALALAYGSEGQSDVQKSINFSTPMPLDPLSHY